MFFLAFNWSSNWVCLRKKKNFSFLAFKGKKWRFNIFFVETVNPGFSVLQIWVWRFQLSCVLSADDKIWNSIVWIIKLNGLSSSLKSLVWSQIDYSKDPTEAPARNNFFCTVLVHFFSTFSRSFCSFQKETLDNYFSFKSLFTIS